MALRPDLFKTVFPCQSFRGAESLELRELPKWCESEIISNCHFKTLCNRDATWTPLLPGLLPELTAVTCRIPRALGRAKCLLQALISFNISWILHPLPVPQRDQELLKLNSFINGMVLVDQNWFGWKECLSFTAARKSKYCLQTLHSFLLTKIKYGPEQSKQPGELYCYAAVTNYLHWIKNRCLKASCNLCWLLVVIVCVPCPHLPFFAIRYKSGVSKVKKKKKKWVILKQSQNKALSSRDRERVLFPPPSTALSPSFEI